MHSKRLHPTEATTASSEVRGRNLRVHLDKLINQLDESTLRATLKLMICESGVAIRRHQGLIALESLGGRNTAPQMDKLRELRTVHDQVFTVYAGRTDTEDDVALQESPHCQPLVGSNQPVRTTLLGVATAPVPRTFANIAVAATKREKVGHVGRKTVCAERTPRCD
jgi:hypothetical protein